MTKTATATEIYNRIREHMLAQMFRAERYDGWGFALALRGHTVTAKRTGHLRLTETAAKSPIGILLADDVYEPCSEEQPVLGEYLEIALTLSGVEVCPVVRALIIKAEKIHAWIHPSEWNEWFPALESASDIHAWAIQGDPPLPPDPIRHASVPFGRKVNVAIPS